MGGLEILLAIEIHPPTLFNSLHDLIRMAFPEYELRAGRCGSAQGRIAMSFVASNDRLLITGSITMNGKTTQDRQDYELKTSEPEQSLLIKRWARTFTYQLICRHLEHNFNPYGILTGVRPVKIVQRFLDEGWDNDHIRSRLETEYLLSNAKADLLINVARLNHPSLLSRGEARKKLSIYIGIPFCPSRCYYCSFPGAVLRDYQLDMVPYMDALLSEMNIIGDFIAGNDWQVQTIYLGGGTPTVITDTDLNRIFTVLHHKYISPATIEITVEAGRPDTLSPTRLQGLKHVGVNRVCINPQTMNDDILKLIGRGHNSQMVIDAVEWARSAGVEHINMDLIVGLPGEKREHFLESVEKVLNLRPDNITVHTLAVKRGSALAEAEGKGNNREKIAAVEEGVNSCERLITQAGYQPYYLYRQKYMKAGLENTGYTLPGSACLYNIQMIEERQTIIGLGGGASSKFVNPSDWSLTSIHNPKDPNRYIKTVEMLSTRKVDKLRALN